MTLPQAEAELQALLEHQYNNDDWRPALKAVTECEPDDNVIRAVSKLRESMSVAPPIPPPIPNGESGINLPEYDDTLTDLCNSIKKLKGHNQLFRDVLTPQEFIELDGEQEEERQSRTDEEIVEEITRGMATLDNDEIIEDEDDGCGDEEEISLAEMMDAATKLEKGALTVGGCGPELSNLCRKFRVELRKTILLEAQQTTLNSYFVRHPS
jgi:hypothetical protein